jgi:2-phosphosulfolactate phosphatase
MALHACKGAQHVFIGGFLNMPVLCEWVKKNRPENLLLVCSGTFEQCAYEDTLAAGAICEETWTLYEGGMIGDSAQIARQIYRSAKANLVEAIQCSRNARRLLSMPDLRDDVAFCLQTGTFPILPEMQGNGSII